MNDQELVTAGEARVAETLDVTEANSARNSPETEVEAVDPRPAAASTEEPSEESPPSTKSDVSETPSIHTLKRGQPLSGKVKNIANFGAFVDIGLPQDGLVHISELARQKVEKVEDIVSVGQEIDVWVKRVDKKRGRISLTMVKPISLRLKAIEENAELEGTVTRLEPYGAFIDIGSERDGLVHISQITHDYIKHPEDALAIGDTVRVKVLKVNRKKRQVDLSIKALLPPPKEEVKEVKEVEEAAKVEEEIIEEKSAPTAMALAYAAMQNKGKPAGSAKNADYTKDRHKRKTELDDIITRTLATSE